MKIMNQFTKYNGSLTLYSRTTGQHRTFRIKTNREDSEIMPGRRIVALLTGSDNEQSYTRFAFINDDGQVQVFKSKQTPVFLKFAEMLNHPDRFTKNYDYLSEKRCRRCNRKLTHPESIESGIGPECMKFE